MSKKLEEIRQFLASHKGSLSPNPAQLLMDARWLLKEVDRLREELKELKKLRIN